MLPAADDHANPAGAQRITPLERRGGGPSTRRRSTTAACRSMKESARAHQASASLTSARRLTSSRITGRVSFRRRACVCAPSAMVFRHVDVDRVLAAGRRLRSLRCGLRAPTPITRQLGDQVASPRHGRGSRRSGPPPPSTPRQQPTTRRRPAPPASSAAVAWRPVTCGWRRGLREFTRHPRSAGQLRPERLAVLRVTVVQHHLGAVLQFPTITPPSIRALV